MKTDVSDSFNKKIIFDRSKATTCLNYAIPKIQATAIISAMTINNNDRPADIASNRLNT